MPLTNTHDTYGAVAKCFHWLMFLLIAGLLAVGFIMSDMENGPDKFKLYGLHKSIGITVLALAFFRLAWRLYTRPPAMPERMKPIEKKLAHLGHAGLYALMFAMPISGWLMSSAAGFSVSVFGLFTLPNLISASHDVAEWFEETHEMLAVALIALIGLHTLAALMHHYVHKDNVLRRMLPFIALLLIASPALAEVPAYTLIKDKSMVKFIALQNHAPVEGRFLGFNAEIRFSSEALKDSIIRAEVDVGSLSIANPDVDKNIRLPEWLSVEAFPKATFVSKTITRTPGTDDYFAEGDMTIRGKTVPVALNFSLKQVDDRAIATGFATLRRTDFGVGQGEWTKDDVIKHEVRLEFRIVAEKIQ